MSLLSWENHEADIIITTFYVLASVTCACQIIEINMVDYNASIIILAKYLRVFGITWALFLFFRDITL